mmetsp:Transcript_87472/g.192131  ORF Transcript_87472/g.192131 Transcript_87472/m.192131 type:complete len:771 (-) Transcript_87472:171-2483(-)
MSFDELLTISWPPPEPEVVSCALQADVQITSTLDKWTSPDFAVTSVTDVVVCGSFVVALLSGSPGVLQESNVVLFNDVDEGANSWPFRPLLLKSFPTQPGSCKQIWPCNDSSFFARCGDSVYRVELPSELDSKEVKPQDVQANKVLDLPPNVVSLACSTDGGSSPVFAMLVASEVAGAKPSGPTIVRPRQSLDQNPPASLVIFDAVHGMRKVSKVPRLSESLSLSKGSRKICVWHAFLNAVPEEAERGEYFAANCSDSDVVVHTLTRGAGRVKAAAVSQDGEFILLQANFSRDRPITTHMALALLVWKKGEEAPRPEIAKIIEGQHILNFGFLSDSNIYVTQLSKTDATTTLMQLLPEGTSKLLGDFSEPVLSRSCAASKESVFYGTESANELPKVARGATLPETGGATITSKAYALPHPDEIGKFRTEVVSYMHESQEVTAILAERTEPELPVEAPLLVLAHGGPAIGVHCSLRLAADAVRYPMRHFLRAGYRILMPLFRGTLGFGDAFAMGNIGSQGSVKGDLGDILAGLDYLQNAHARLKGSIHPSRTGIFGGSYGGYMTLRAMSEASDRFGAGVALYGFVHNRWMSYQGGDFTYEDEYLVPPPLPVEEAQAFEMELVVEEADSAKPDTTPSGTASPAARPLSSARDRNPSMVSCSSQGASDVWPLPKEMEKSDVFNGLHRIGKPLLLMHGEKDDICPLSQSEVAFHMMEKMNVPTGLVVYPGEGHGFDLPEHQQDRDRRMLAWFAEHLEGDREEARASCAEKSGTS